MTTATKQAYTIVKYGETLQCVTAADDRCLALAGPHASRHCLHPESAWIVMLGTEAANVISATDDERFSSFVVRDEDEARKWLGVLARMYFANPDPS